MRTSSTKRGRVWGRQLAVAVMLVLAQPALAAAGGDYRISTYVAKNSPDRFLDILRSFDAKLRDSHVAVVAVGYPFTDGEWVRWELEGQIGQHWGLQSHPELNAVLVARWMRFPWDRWLDTRFAFGQGFSFAFRTPPLEPRADPDEGESSRLLNYLLAEIEVVIPGAERWRVFTRIHHRSGIFGLYGGVDGGSNFIGWGLRYRM